MLAFSHTAMAQEGTTAEPEAAPAEPVTTTQPVTAETAPPPTSASPPGRSPGRGLIIGGWVTFGVLYLPALAAGIGLAITSHPANAILIIPGFGPLVVGALSISAGGVAQDAGAGDAVSSTAKAIGAVFIVWGILQMGGIAMAAAGHVLHARWKDGMNLTLRSRDGKRGLLFTPMATRESVGVGLAGWF